MAFVGREPELDELERALAETRDGRGGTVLLAGEAGIGKTRLASEIALRARDADFEVLVGRSIDFAGSELPYLPFTDALGDLGEAGSQLRVFRGALTTIAERARRAPLLLELEDLHWADTSTLDLVAFLAHNIDDLPVLLLATYRADEPESGARVRRLAEGVRRSGAAVVLELGPFAHEEVATLLDARSDAPVPAALANAIAVRSEGNPFFAEELLAASDSPSGALPRGLSEVLTARVAGLDVRTQSVLRAAAVAGRDVAYPLLCAVAGLPEDDVRGSLRRAVDNGVLVADRERASLRFRHALLAEAMYARILPGEREELHERVADELASAGAPPGELAPHWAAAGRAAAALVASVEAATAALAVFGLSEARGHLERALALWDSVSDAASVAEMRLDELCARAADLASRTGDAPRAVELTRRAIDLAGDGDPLFAAHLHECLGGYLFESGAGDTFLAAVERAVELVPAEPPSPERAHVLTTLAGDLSVVWRYEESLAICDEALALAREVGAPEAEVRALIVLGIDHAYLGRGDDALARLEEARALAAATDDFDALYRVYVAWTDVLTMLGRPREAARVAEEGLEALRPDEADHTVLVANRIEALLAIGEWDAADREGAVALRAVTANYPHMPLILRADIELGRGRFGAARAHLEAAGATVRHEPGIATYQGYVAELALWERRWVDAEEAVRCGMAAADPAWGAQIRVWLCSKGLRAQAEVAALARARGDETAVDRELLAAARTAAADASSVTPNAEGWLALAEAEHARAGGAAAVDVWSRAASTWDRLERPPVAAYCRWREAEALVAAGASRTGAAEPLRAAHDVATRLGAEPLRREIELLAQRARLDLAPPPPRDVAGGLEEALGLTRREAEVLTLLARGYTNREIAATLVISVKTASVHVSHILGKLRVANRQEAAAVAHRFAPPGVERTPDA